MRVVIIASIGRCGSSLTYELICRSIKASVNVFDRISPGEARQFGVIKTHRHFSSAFPDDGRGLYLYDAPENSIASLYCKRMDARFMRAHLNNLQVTPSHAKEFFSRMARSSDDAFAYLIEGDKFRFMENMNSWFMLRRILFISYHDLCQKKDRSLLKMSKVVGFNIPDFIVRPRETSIKVLPCELLRLIRRQYYPRWYFLRLKLVFRNFLTFLFLSKEG